MSGRRSIVRDAKWDAMTEQHMHPFTEQEVIDALVRLRDAINSWDSLRQRADHADADLVECGHELLDVIPAVLLAFRSAIKRRQKEIAAEYRALAKPAAYRE
jgi:hypothetical protein